MAMNTKLTSSVFAFLAMLSFALLAHGEQAIPFKGTASGTVSAPVLVSVNPPTILSVATGSGHATHFGTYTYVLPHYINLVDFSLSGVISMTAANGDVLVGNMVGQAIPTAVPGVINLGEEITITGGTGRFESATGSIVVSGPADPSAGWVGPLDMEGMISY